MNGYESEIREMIDRLLISPVKLYQFFGVVGIASLLAWLAATFLMMRELGRAASARFLGRARGKKRPHLYLTVFVIGTVGLLLAKNNSRRVSRFEYDQKEGYAETIKKLAEKAREEEAEAEERAADIEFAEDAPLDKYDLAGVRSYDKKNIYEAAAAGVEVEPPENPGGPESPESKEKPPGEEEEPAEDEENVPAYRKRGKRTRSEGKAGGDFGSEKVAEFTV